MDEQQDLTPEEWREVAASEAPYVATRLGPVNTTVARIFLAMEPRPAILRFTDGDWALLQTEGEDVYRLGALLPEPDAASVWYVDQGRHLTATAADLRALAKLITDTLDGNVQADPYRVPAVG